MEKDRLVEEGKRKVEKGKVEKEEVERGVQAAEGSSEVRRKGKVVVALRRCLQQEVFALPRQP